MAAVAPRPVAPLRYRRSVSSWNGRVAGGTRLPYRDGVGQAHSDYVGPPGPAAGPFVQGTSPTAPSSAVPLKYGVRHPPSAQKLEAQADDMWRLPRSSH